MTWDDTPFLALELKLLVIECWQQETGEQGIDSHAVLVDLTARTGVRAGLYRPIYGARNEEGNDDDRR